MSGKIWWDKSWNPITGCSQISPGCNNCWAKRMANRLRGRYGYPADEPFRVTFHPDRLGDPAKWKKPCRVFICSMGDLFHEECIKYSNSAKYVRETLAAAAEAKHHTYIILTKRPEKAVFYFKSLNPAFIKELIPNLYLGVTVESNEQRWRIDELLKLRDYAKVLFVSAEPLLGELDLCQEHGQGVGDLLIDNLNLIIAGGESGPGARPSHPDWFRKIRDDCKAAGVAFWFKQWGEWLPYSQAQSDEQQEAVSKTPIAGKQTYFSADIDFGNMIAPHMQAVQTNMIGKRKAGNLLDGVKHEGWPK